MNEKPSQGGSYIKDAKGKLKLVARTKPVATTNKTAPEKGKGEGK
ncbi:hypothetical protein [Pseudoalteromonas maricaloris]|nr:hypothetical protein [Pseudoalteromonas flavipulchra]